MKLTALIKTLIELNEHDPDVEMWALTDPGTERCTPRTFKITHVTGGDCTVTIYGEEEQ